MRQVQWPGIPGGLGAEDGLSSGKGSHWPKWLGSETVRSPKHSAFGEGQGNMGEFGRGRRGDDGLLGRRRMSTDTDHAHGAACGLGRGLRG